MKYIGMPMGMWALFAGSFQKQLTEVLGYDTDTAKAITKKAKPKYKVIIADNIHSALFSVAAYTVILCFSLFKTGSLAKSIFHAH